MGINHIGHFYLTRLLLPHINKGGRIVTVASSAHSAVRKFCVDDLNFTQGASRYSPWTGYTNSKLANILFAKALQDKVVEHGRDDILSLSLHPGIVKSTNLWRQSDYLLVETYDSAASSSISRLPLATLDMNSYVCSKRTTVKQKRTHEAKQRKNKNRAFGKR